MTVRKLSHFIGGRNSVFLCKFVVWCPLLLFHLNIRPIVIFGDSSRYEKKADYFECDVSLIIHVFSKWGFLATFTSTVSKDVGQFDPGLR